MTLGSLNAMVRVISYSKLEEYDKIGEMRAQSVFTCSKLTIETLEQDVK